jgi:aspartokinase
MPTVAHLVQKYVRSLPHLEQFIERDLVSFHRLARHLKPQIQKELGKEVEDSAIVMALSRMRDKLRDRSDEQIKNPGYSKMKISLQSGALQIDLKRGTKTGEKLREIQQIVKDGGEILSITQSMYEITIISEEKHEKQFLGILKGEKILNVEKNLSLLMLRFGDELLYQPGFLDRVLKELSWENINVYEIISTLTELIVVLKEDQAGAAYEVIRKSMH